jgi:hypothetical protein
METYEALKDSVIKVLNELPPSEVAEVLDFARFVQAKNQKKRQAVLKTGSFDDLQPLVGMVALGGDAVVDCDNLEE